MNGLIGVIGFILGLAAERVAHIFILEESTKNLKKSIISLISQLKNQENYSKATVLIPVIAALISILLYIKYGLILTFFKFLFFMTMMILIGYIDFKTTYVYRVTTLMTAIIGVIFITLESWKLQTFPFDYLLGSLIGFLVIGLIVFITRGMGEGDIEIAALCGLFLGTIGSMLTLFLGIVFGGIGGAILLARQAKGLKDEMAFGPYLVIAAMISMLWAHQIFDIYMSLF